MRSPFHYLPLLVLLLVLTVTKQRACAAVSQCTGTSIFLDTLENHLLLCYEDQYPAYYKSEVFTPVCPSSECLPIRIDLYWTLAGHYLRYVMPDAEILTKVDHLHFTTEDYVKLDQILKNPNGTLKYLHKEDFQWVNPADPSQKMDGVTGATRMVSKRDYVEGAIFTSLTLFQMVHGPVVSQMRSFTLGEVIQRDNVEYFITHPDRETANLGFSWLQSKLTDEELLEVLLPLMHSATPQVCDLAVRYLPPSSVAVDSIEQKMCALYGASLTSDDTRTQLLALWTGHELLPETQLTLGRGLLRFRENFAGVLLILEQQQQWPDELYTILCDAIMAENNLSRKEKIYRVLEDRESTFSKAIKKKAKELAKLNGWN